MKILLFGYISDDLKLEITRPNVYFTLFYSISRVFCSNWFDDLQWFDLQWLKSNTRVIIKIHYEATKNECSPMNYLHRVIYGFPETKLYKIFKNTISSSEQQQSLLRWFNNQNWYSLLCWWSSSSWKQSQLPALSERNAIYNFVKFLYPIN